jgi:hypothetical protein
VFDHVGFGVANLADSKAFFLRALMLLSEASVLAVAGCSTSQVPERTAPPTAAAPAASAASTAIWGQAPDPRTTSQMPRLPSRASSAGGLVSVDACAPEGESCAAPGSSCCAGFTCAGINSSICISKH